MRTSWSQFAFAFGLVACAPSKIDVDFNSENGSGLDSDGDGIDDRTEGELGTDPMTEDTDGDGWADGVEVDGNTDPLDRNDHPYIGGWPIDSCRHDIVETGDHQVGDILPNHVVLDQYGEEISLHDFCDHVVLLESAGFT